MNSPRCTVFLPSQRYPKKAIRALHYDGQDLAIDIQGEGFSFARVVFREPIGFRLLDERDLCEFWNAYGENLGWLYEVHEGGWLELERQRELFDSPEVFRGLLEYLIVDDKCISVLATEAPEIRDRGTKPPSSTDP